MRHRVWLCRGVSCRVGETAGVTLEATPAATPQGKAATAAVYQWPSAGSGFAWGFSSRLSLPPRKRPVIPDRPRFAALSSRSPRLRLPAARVTPAVSLVYRGGLVVERGVASSLRWLFARRARSYRPPCIPPLRSPCGRSEPCSRTLSLTKANEAMHPRQASGPANEAHRRSSHPQPQSPKEPAGATLASGSRRRGRRLEEARKGPVRDDRPFSGRQGQPTRKPPVGARPGRRPLIHGRGSGLSLWGRRRRGREGGTRRLFDATPHAAATQRRGRKPSPPPKKDDHKKRPANRRALSFHPILEIRSRPYPRWRLRHRSQA